LLLSKIQRGRAAHSPFAARNCARDSADQRREANLKGSRAGSLLQTSDCALERLSTALERLTLVLGQIRLEDVHDALSPEHPRRRERDAVARVIGADRNHDSLVPQHRLGDARGYHADSKFGWPDFPQ